MRPQWELRRGNFAPHRGDPERNAECEPDPRRIRLIGADSIRAMGVADNATAIRITKFSFIYSYLWILP